VRQGVVQTFVIQQLLFLGKTRKRKNYDAGVSCGAESSALAGGGVASVEATGFSIAEVCVSGFAAGFVAGVVGGLGGGLGFSGLIPASQ
jgi:hypothetical protein